MGRDTRSNQTGFNVRAKLYKSSIDDETERITKRDYINYTIFYAKDYQSFELTRNVYGEVMQRTLVSGYIQTMDLKLGEIKIHDMVEYMDKKYNVEDVRFEDNNSQKEISNRPMLKTIIKLGAING